MKREELEKHYSENCPESEINCHKCGKPHQRGATK